MHTRNARIWVFEMPEYEYSMKYRKRRIAWAGCRAWVSRMARRWDKRTLVWQSTFIGYVVPTLLDEVVLSPVDGGCGHDGLQVQTVVSKLNTHRVSCLRCGKRLCEDPCNVETLVWRFFLFSWTWQGIGETNLWEETTYECLVWEWMIATRWFSESHLLGTPGRLRFCTGDVLLFAHGHEDIDALCIAWAQPKYAGYSNGVGLNNIGEIVIRTGVFSLENPTLPTSSCSSASTGKSQEFKRKDSCIWFMDYTHCQALDEYKYTQRKRDVLAEQQSLLFGSNWLYMHAAEHSIIQWSNYLACNILCRGCIREFSLRCRYAPRWCLYPINNTMSVIKCTDVHKELVCTQCTRCAQAKPHEPRLKCKTTHDIQFHP